MPTHASYSSVDAYLECGLKYRLTRIEGHKEDPAWWSVGGSAVHKATEWWDYGSGFTADELFTDAFADQIKREAELTDTDPESWRSSRGQSHKWWTDNGPDMVQAWIDWRTETGWRILDLPHPDPDAEWQPAVEARFEVSLTPGSMPVKGYIDRVFVDDAGQAVIVDLKTGARKPPSAMQLGYYRAGLIAQYGLTVDVGGYWMARKKPGEQFEAVGLTRYTPEFVARFVSGFQKALDMGHFVPHVTSFCKTCGVAAHCWAVA